MGHDDDVEDDVEVIDDIGLTFSPSDTTVSVPCPARHVFVLPKNVSHVQLWTLPHPRHNEMTTYLSGTDGGGSDVLCEVQERRHAFGDMWFLGDHVEPSSGLYIATPIDCTFMAIALARKGGGLAEKFVPADDLISTRCEHVAQLPNSILDQIRQSLRLVCEVKSFGPDEEYYRFSEHVFKGWIQRKHAQLLAGTALAALLGVGAATKAAANTVVGDAQQTQDLLKAKGLALLNEYLHASLHEVAASACGVLPTQPDNSVRKPPMSHQAPSQNSLDSTKQKVELKSASVKRLEKAGPPKGTPTLMAMFAKKKAQQPEQQPEGHTAS